MSPRVRRAPAAAAVLLAALGAWLWVRAADDGVAVVAKGPPTFNFRHPDDLRSVPPRGEELVRFEERRRGGGRVASSAAVEPLSVPAHAGSAAAAMPALIEAELASLHRRFPGLHVT